MQQEKKHLEGPCLPQMTEAKPTSTPAKGRWLGPAWQLLHWDSELQTDGFDHPITYCKEFESFCDKIETHPGNKSGKLFKDGFCVYESCNKENKCARDI